jgi:hypothetical protein
MPAAHPVLVGIGQNTCQPEEHTDFLLPLQPGKIAVESAYSAGIFSGQEPGQPWEREGHGAMQERLDARQGPALNMNPKGTATVEACTVMHDREGMPDCAIIVARPENGERCLALTETTPIFSMPWKQRSASGRRNG